MLQLQHQVEWQMQTTVVRIQAPWCGVLGGVPGIRGLLGGLLRAVPSLVATQATIYRSDHTKTGSCGLKVKVRMPSKSEFVCHKNQFVHHIVCESSCNSRDFYAIRPLILWHILGAYVLLVWGVVSKLFSNLALSQDQSSTLNPKSADFTSWTWLRKKNPY